MTNVKAPGVYRTYATPQWRFYDLLKMLGKTQDINALLEQHGYPVPPPTTIQGWRTRRKLPADWVPVFLQLALDAGFIKSINDLRMEPSP